MWRRALGLLIHWEALTGIPSMVSWISSRMAWCMNLKCIELGHMGPWAAWGRYSFLELAMVYAHQCIRVHLEKYELRDFAFWDRLPANQIYEFHVGCVSQLSELFGKSVIHFIFQETCFRGYAYSWVCNHVLGLKWYMAWECDQMPNRYAEQVCKLLLSLDPTKFSNICSLSHGRTCHFHAVNEL